MEEQIQTEKINPNWLQKELAEIQSTQVFDGEKKPALQFEESKITEFDIDISEEWTKWYDEENKTTKKIIPCKRGEVECVWWLNVRNPIYREVVEACASGETHFKIMQTGKGKSTKYAIVKE
jgi:hypothetical protein